MPTSSSGAAPPNNEMQTCLCRSSPGDKYVWPVAVIIPCHRGRLSDGSKLFTDWHRNFELIDVRRHQRQSELAKQPTAVAAAFVGGASSPLTYSEESRNAISAAKIGICRHYRLLVMQRIFVSLWHSSTLMRKNYCICVIISGRAYR